MNQSLSRTYRHVLALLSVVVVVYAAVYLAGFDPAPYYVSDYDGELARGLSQLAVFYSLGLAPVVLMPRRLWSTWFRAMVFLLPAFGVLYYFMAADSDFWFGPIAATEILGPLFVIAAWVWLGISWWRGRSRLN